MKLSLFWIFEHINGSWRSYKIDDLVAQFNKTTAEIEDFYPLKLDLDNFSLVKIEGINFKDINAISLEWNKKLSVPLRSDIKTGGWFLIKKQGKEYIWATLADFGALSKEGLMPEVTCAKKDQKGAWKKAYVAEDYIFELDNTSITHRADLWAVRGIAREFAAILNLELKPLKNLLAEKKVETCASRYMPKNAITIVNKVPKQCLRFAGLYFSEVENCPSALWMALLLCRTDNRPIDLLVDATNYIMLDLGQPMHAFDADKIATKRIEPRMAKSGEKLRLLDGAELKLSAKDIVITDGKKSLALAGVMGGFDSGITKKTKSLFLESANFDSSTVRLTVARHRVRTESSMRFEKGLDPNQNVTGIKRFLKLLDDEKVAYNVEGPIASLGKEFKPYKISISHEVIERNLGVSVSKKFIMDALKKNDFIVKADARQVYHVTVPTFRGTKDVTIAVDIVEEVGRFWGWDNIPYVLPTRVMLPSDVSKIMRLRTMKQQVAFGMHMHEVNNYPFFDESFLRELQWEPMNAVRAKNPLSQNVTRLVTSLVPHLLKNVQQNISKTEQLRFFELNTVWHLKKKSDAEEKKSLAGVLWDYTGKIDFYTGKKDLLTFFDMLHFTVSWIKPKCTVAAWYNEHQVAELMLGKTCVGYAGMIDQAFAEKVGIGTAFIFELDVEEILAYHAKDVVFKPLAKYPYIYNDISMLIPIEHAVGVVDKAIRMIDKRIYDVDLRDMFTKDGWGDKRSLTFRFYMRDLEKTLTKYEADAINKQVIESMKKFGAEIR